MFDKIKYAHQKNVKIVNDGIKLNMAIIGLSTNIAFINLTKN